MPRNVSGVYTLPAAAGNPVVSATSIEPDWANQTLNDVADALTASLPRDGAAPMTGPLLLSGNAAVALAAVPKQQLDAAIAAVSVSASDVSNTPAGGISATTVQNALNELDSEKQTAAQVASAITSSGLGGSGQTWTDVKTSPGRAKGSTYTNSSGKPIQVLITQADGGGGVAFQIDGVTVAAAGSGATTANHIISAIIPDGSTYGLTNTGGAVAYWYELI